MLKRQMHGRTGPDCEDDESSSLISYRDRKHHGTWASATARCPLTWGLTKSSSIDERPSSRVDGVGGDGGIFKAHVLQ